MDPSRTGLPSPKRAAPLPPDERRQAIVEAVLPLLVERGSGVTSRELAKAAGVAEGTIWKVFSDKRDLLATAIRQAIDPTAFDHAVAALDPQLGFEERLVATTELMGRRMHDIWQLVSQAELEVPTLPDGRFPDNATVVALFERERHRVRVPPVQAARQLRALVLSLGNPKMVDPPLTAVEIVELFLHGVGTGVQR